MYRFTSQPTTLVRFRRQDCCSDIMMLIVIVLVLAFLPYSAGNAARDLTKLHKDFFKWRMSDVPLVATYYQVTDYNDKLESYNMSMFDVRKNKAEELHTRLKAIPTSELDKVDRLNYGILNDQLTTYINGYHWRHFNYLNIINFLEGPQINPSSFFVEIHPFLTRGDFENYIVRLNKMVKQLTEMSALMSEAIRLNRTNHIVSMSRLHEQFDQLDVTDPTHSAFYSPFNKTLETSTVAEEDRAGLRQRGSTAVAGLLKAFRDLWAFIQQEYIPNSRPEIGISSLDGGREYYEACIRWYLSENITAQEVHDIGLREVDRIEQNMQKIMAKQGFSGTPGDYFRSLMNDSRFTFSTGEEILDVYREEMSIISENLPELFVNIPDLPIEVRAFPVDGPAGLYYQGSPDGSRPGIFYANVLRPSQIANYTTMVLTLHEALPGHHLQLSYSMLANTPEYRQKMEFTELARVPFAFPYYNSFVEGWGLYAEYLGEEMGVYRDDYELLGRYSDEILRAVRLVVDTGMHVFGWPREKALQYFLNYTSESFSAASLEIDRYITWPGQALSYKIGEMKIKQLRNKAETKLGKKFDIRAFHSVVLESGTIPLNVLENLVNDWIDTVATSEHRPVPCGTPDISDRHLWFILLSVIQIVELSACHT